MWEDELTENEKEALARVVKFKEFTKGFWAPDSAREYADKINKEAGGPDAGQAPGAPKAADLAKPKSPPGSARASGAEEEDQEELPPFSPLIPEFWKQKCLAFGALHIVKFERILQSLFYLLFDFTREDICEHDTNKLSWKRCRKYFAAAGETSVYNKMNEYWPIGAKDKEFKEYQKLKFIKANVDNIDENDVDEFSMSLGKVYRWLLMALELRIEDVTNRRAAKEKEREFRADAIEREAERMERYENSLVEEREAFETK